MFSLKSIVLVAVAFAVRGECSGVPAVAAAPLVAPAVVGYSQAIPQNVPPFASQVSIVNRAFSRLIASPAVATAPLAAGLTASPAVAAAPLAAPFAAPVAAPLTAPVAAPLAATFAAPVGAPLAAPYASYITGPAPVVPAAYSAPAAYAAPFPYSAPYLAPALVR